MTHKDSVAALSRQPPDRPTDTLPLPMGPVEGTPVYGAFMESNPLLVSWGDLDRWAATEESKGTFPELMRRLLAQTPGVTNINIRAREGTAAPGWDGTATSAGSAFLPEGELRFEFGTNQDPKRKANEDYEKRAQEAAGTKGEVYLFATPRNWAGAAAWAKERQNEGVFASVEAFDAHRLEGWLESVPAVHYWISERLEKPTSGAQTLTAWWERLRRNCTIEVPPGFHTAGRHKEADKLLDLLATNDKVPSVQAAWRDDALAFCHALLHDRDPAALDRALVVSDAQRWHQLAIQPSSLILIPLFDDPDIGLAQDNGHSVIHPVVEVNDTRDDNDIVRLPKIDRWGGATSLTEAELDFPKADKLTALARRSMCGFYRRISRDKSRQHPEWAKDRDTVRILAPLVLVGAWEAEHAGDLDSISRFVGIDGNEINARLDELVDRYPLDPPFVRSGGQWRLVDAMDAAALLLPKLSPSHLERWEKLLNDVLLAASPLEDKSATEALKALMDGLRPPFSETLPRHLASGLALAAATSGRKGGSLAGVGRYVDRTVPRLVERGVQDESGCLLGRLAPFLPYLAEASPGRFLDVVELGLEHTEAAFSAGVTQAKDGPEFMLVTLPELKSALQCLSWSPDYFGRAVRALAQLGDLASDESYRRDYAEAVTFAVAGWSPFGASDWREKSSLVAWMLQQYPSFGWPLIDRLVFHSGGLVLEPFRPLYRDWNTQEKEVSNAVVLDYLHEVVGAAVRLAEGESDRLLRLLRVVDRLPTSERLLIIRAIRSAAAQGKWDDDQALEACSLLRSMVNRHQSSTDAPRAWSEEQLRPLVELLAQLEPVDDPRRFAWLFDYERCITIRGKTGRDEGFDEILREERDRALTSVIQRGDAQLRALVGASKNVNYIGEFLAHTDSELEPCILSWLDRELPALHRAASAYVWSTTKQRGMPWVRSTLEQGFLGAEGQRRLVASLPCDKEMWPGIEDLDEALSRTYWENVSVFQINKEDGDEVLDILLEYGCAAQAIALLSRMIDVEQKPKASQVVRALSLWCESRERGETTASSYEAEELLTWLESEAGDHPDLPTLEFRLLACGHDLTPSDALYRILGREPVHFAALVTGLYDSREGEEGQETRAHQFGCWQVLNHWRRLPGLSDDGTIDGEYLARWVEEARMLLRVDGLGDIADTQIGKVLASSPDGSDGMWPAEEVRDLLEDTKSRDLEQGMVTGRYNRRGGTTRGVLDGGAQEWSLARRYREHSRKMSARWPRAAAVLGGLAEDYEREAELEDERAEERADQD